MITFWEHCYELRRSLIAVLAIILLSTSVAFFFHDALIKAVVADVPVGVQIILLEPVEGFATVVKLCFWSAITLSSPLWLYVIWLYSAPALHAWEKRFFFLIVVGSCLCLAAGIFFAQKITVPIANQFFAAFNQGIGANYWSWRSYLEYNVFLLLANGLAFEMALLLIFLVHFDIITPAFMAQYRRHAIVISLIVSALLTPPDLFTQLMLAFPLILLYEGVLAYYRLRKGR